METTMTHEKKANFRRTLMIGMFAAVAAAAAPPVFAQSFPVKPLELVVLFPAGSAADVTARALSEQMSKKLGQPIFVVNKPGGGGSIGYRYVQQKPADGVGVLASTREPAFPGVPTTAEAGMAYNGEMWRGIASPKGTPPAVVSRLEQALQEAVASPEFKAQGAKLGFVPAFMPANELGPLIAKDDVMLARLMDRAGLKLK
jgi:tripartite-type tricarboxylate transporter receptor subunit TctC